MYLKDHRFMVADATGHVFKEHPMCGMGMGIFREPVLFHSKYEAVEKAKELSSKYVKTYYVLEAVTLVATPVEVTDLICKGKK